MSRHGYSEDLTEAELNLYRANIARAIAGKRGQAFLKELVVALDALPHPRLIEEEIEENGEVCALGAVYKFRGLDTESICPDDHKGISKDLNIARSFVAEIEYENDDGAYGMETPEQKFKRMRAWAINNIRGADVPQ